MTDLNRLLLSTSKTTFVNWLEVCKKNYPDGQTAIVKKMIKKEGFAELSARSRVGKIYRIIREDLIAEACDSVITSQNSRLSNAVKRKAKKLKAKYCD